MNWYIRKVRSLLTQTPLYRVGWVTFDAIDGSKTRFFQLRAFTRMRTGNIAEWINANSPIFYNELYKPKRQYDIVVFQKMMDGRCQREVQRIHAYGGKVVFDANVNYYDVWGDYFVPGTRPTEEQQQDAVWMTRHADWVVADSSVLAEVAQKFNPYVTWIPDNVNLSIYSEMKKHRPKNPVRLVWSGMSKKALHLLLIQDVLGKLENAELFLVSDQEPEVLHQLAKKIPCHFVRFKDHTYAKLLLDCDIIISPKRLCNGYAASHTEYKITLGMAVGLPAVASPQQSYIEAISHNQGGIIAHTEQEWFEALNCLVNNHQLRNEMGARARQTVLERYSTPVVAKQYLEVLKQVLEVDNTKNSKIFI
jgi:glycosyltransferase involved in cell wall biosynthesis